MGMPLSYFNAFWAAQKPDLPGHQRAVELFDRFSMLAFVLYDPREDPELHRRLQNEWQMLDGLTGEHLLFFAPVDPPDAWALEPQVPGHGAIRLAQKRISGGPDRLSQERGYMPLVSEDPSQTSAAFRQMLGVPAGMESCLVIASNLHDAQVWLLSTDATQVGPQLERLGSLASLATRKSLTRQAVEPYIARIAGEAGAIIEALALTARLSSVLTDVCAMTAARGVIQDPMTETRAREQLLKSAYERTRFYYDEGDTVAILRLAQASAVIAATPVTLRGEARYDISLGDCAEDKALPSEPYFDPPRSSRTAQLLRMGDDCLRHIRDGMIGDRHDPDYRVAVASWAQALEYEMAEQMGHEVRAGLGITLPQFHWRKQPGLHQIEIACASHNGPIPFNQARLNCPDPDRALWQPPAMGPLRLGWEAWRARVGAPVPQDLTALLLRCKDTRNAASHAGEPIQFRHALEAQADMREAISMIAGLGIQSWGARDSGHSRG